MERKGHDASFAARNSAQLNTIYSQVAARLGAWLIGALQEFWRIQRIADADQYPFLPRDIFAETHRRRLRPQAGHAAWAGPRPAGV